MNPLVRGGERVEPTSQQLVSEGKEVEDLSLGSVNPSSRDESAAAEGWFVVVQVVDDEVVDFLGKSHNGRGG